MLSVYIFTKKQAQVFLDVENRLCIKVDYIFAKPIEVNKISSKIRGFYIKGAKRPDTVRYNQIDSFRYNSTIFNYKVQAMEEIQKNI